MNRTRFLGFLAAVANVALMVRTHHGPTAADRAFLVKLFDALERAALSAG